MRLVGSVSGLPGTERMAKRARSPAERVGVNGREMLMISNVFGYRRRLHGLYHFRPCCFELRRIRDHHVTRKNQWVLRLPGADSVNVELGCVALTVGVPE